MPIISAEKEAILRYRRITGKKIERRSYKNKKVFMILKLLYVEYIILLTFKKFLLL